MTEIALNPADSDRNSLTVQQLLHSLSDILAPARTYEQMLDSVAQEAFAAVQCDHLFISRYDGTDKVFSAVAWRSSINPGSVSLEQKFMGASYLSGQQVIINDLSSYNYRLRPAVARLGLASMAGIPFMLPGTAVGVIEAFSEKPDHFSDIDLDLLTLLAKQTALIMEKAGLERECRLRSAETELLIEALKLEQASIGSLLYKMGETFASLFDIDGIAVFGIDHQVEGSPLQEVMAKGFAMSDIRRLKTLFNQKYLERLVTLPEGNKHGITKQSLRQPGPGGTKLLFIVPIIYKQSVYGIMVFYWEGSAKETVVTDLERFSKRIIDDITMMLSRKHLYDNIQKISFSDILTGLSNRRLFDYVLDRELKKAVRTAKPLSLLMIDIDFFKNVNDAFGHQTGDFILEQCGAIIKESCRNADLAARYGGEEFAIILPETDRGSALIVAERLREKIAAYQLQMGKQLLRITVSIGGATYHASQGSSSPDSLILAADQALYQAKKMGRNVVMFSGNSKNS